MNQTIRKVATERFGTETRPHILSLRVSAREFAVIRKAASNRNYAISDLLREVIRIITKA